MARMPLVTSHLERISYKIFEEHSKVIARLVQGHAGIYALYRRSKLYYVGLASSLRSRVNHHLKDRHRNKWDSFSLYLTLKDDHMKELESLLLRIAKPVGNKVSGKFARSTDLLGETRRLMNEEHERSVAAMLGGKEAARFRRRHSSRGPGRQALAGLFERTVPLRARYKGKILKASLRRDGHIRLGKMVFQSLSSAANAIGTTRNGWNFWSFKDPQTGVWRKLHTVRK